MSDTLSQHDKWRSILRRQQTSNIEQWLHTITSSPDPTHLIIDNYDNLLRALEVSLENPTTFALGHRLIRVLFPVVFGYADWDRWLVYLESALTISQALPAPQAEADLLDKLADLLARQGNLVQAETYYIASSQLYSQLSDDSNYAAVLSKLAAIYGTQEKTELGIKLCQEALMIATTIDAKWVTAHANLSLSHIYLRSHNLEAALATAQEAYRLYQADGNLSFAAKALSNLILIWLQQDTYPQQDIAVFMDTLTQSGDLLMLSRLKNNLGILAYNQKQYEAAEIAWQEALQLQSQVNDPLELAHLHNNLGKVYTQLEEWETADLMLQRARETYHMLGILYEWANAMDNLAELYEAQGKTAVCRQTLQQAIRNATALKETIPGSRLLAAMEQKLARLT